MQQRFLVRGATLAAGLGLFLGSATYPEVGVAQPETTQPETSTPTRSTSQLEGQGIGDPYYPDDGNRGYDVKGYWVKLDYFRNTQRIEAATTIRSVAKARLSRLNLDLLGMTVSSVRVNGQRARFARAGDHELVITPRRAVRAGDAFKTVVTYSGKPRTITEDQVTSGWFPATTPGAGFIAGEPHACTVWYPCNDHPTDKAKFRLNATVPRPFAAVSVGSQLKTTAGMRGHQKVRTYRWNLDERTATYLTTVYIDRLSFRRSTLRGGIPVVDAYGPNPGSAPQREANLPEILTVLSRRWGPYPAPTAGGIFIRGDVPFSLETYGRPVYTEGAGIGTIVHENGHQWWGDNVSIKRWRDICFNECVASYSQWLWNEHQGRDLDRDYRRDVKGTPNWLFGEPLYDMGAGNEFGYGVYVKGTYFLHALRNKVGDRQFFEAMQAIQRERAGGNMSMIEWREAMERRTEVNLTRFWREWVLETGAPSKPNLYPGDL